MILDKVIIVVCCLAAAIGHTAAAEVVDGNNKESPRSSRSVLLPPYYSNNGQYYNNPWNYNYYNNNNPHRYYNYNPYRHYSSRVPIAGGTVNPNDYQSPILYSNDVRHPDGSYFYEFETANGIRRLENSVQTLEGNAVQGSYSHVGPDGRTYTVNYIADKNGYRASGDHLPQQPQPVVSAAPLLSHRPIVVTTPRPHYSGSNKVVVAPIAATAFPAYDYRHHAAFAHPNNVYVSPYHPFSTARPYLGHPATVVHPPYPLGKK